MNPLVVAMAIAAGICIDAALIHGMAGLSGLPRDRARLAFPIGAAAVAVGSLAVIGLYSAESPHTHAAIMKWLYFPANVVWLVAGVWFVAYYTGVRPARFLYALTAGFGIVLALDLMLPLGILHSESGPLRSVEVFGTRLMLDDPASPHPLNIVNEALAVGVFAYLGFAVYQAYRKGDRRRAGTVALAVLVFGAATVIDTLSRYGVVSSFYTTQLCFAGLVLAMSIALRRESLRTETELAVYRARLEAMVEERVRDLDKANWQLALEVSERQAAEESLRQRVEQLDGLQRVSQTLADRTDLASALDEASDEIAKLFKARLARVYLRLPVWRTDGGSPARVEERYTAGDAAAAATTEDVWVEDVTVFRQIVEGHEPVAFEDLDAVALPSELDRLVKNDEVARLLLLPMVARGDGVGILVIARDGPSPAFSSAESTLAQAMADALAAVVENERLHEQQTRQAAEDERQRLAHDLHDAVTQSIYSASLIAEALPTVWEREPDEGLYNLVRLRRLVRAALAEMRTLLFELRPAALEAAPLCTLLERLGDALSGQAQIPVEVNLEHDHELPPEVKLTLYRVAQESFSNIAKHARASQATASLSVDERGVTLTVVDDGRGFDPGAIAPERMGLRIMRERLDRIGASLEVDSEPERGTRITAFWPRLVGAARRIGGGAQHDDAALRYAAGPGDDAGQGDATDRREDTLVGSDGNKGARTPEEEGERELSRSHKSAHS